MNECGVCALHADPAARQRYEIGRGPLWILRHHPDPAPLTGWLLLDAVRHLGGPLEFTAAEASAWGLAVQKASQLVQQLSGCDRVYAIAFGEGARHLHLHLIPRFGSDPQSEAWKVADLYRAVACGARPPAPADAIQACVNQARDVLEAAEPWL
jgi:diadenosine tetraphosphate (Ap4A) HIT family hydrolase